MGKIIEATDQQVYQVYLVNHTAQHTGKMIEVTGQRKASESVRQACSRAHTRGVPAKHAES